MSGHVSVYCLPQMQERSALRRLLNATIVVCGASYILYVAVYLGLDLKSIIARPLHEPASIKLRLHTNPAEEVRLLILIHLIRLASVQYATARRC